MKIINAMRLLLWGTCIITYLGLTGCATVPITGRNRTILLNESDLSVASAQQYTQLTSKAPLSQSVTANAMLDRVAQRLVSATRQLAKTHGFERDLDLFKWEFKLIDDPKMINAFCMPGGKVVVYTGILEVAQDDAGLAVILGHEIAHALAKHGNERMSQNKLVTMGGSILELSTQQSSEETQALVGLAYGAGTTLGVLLPYSRLHETEADKIGLMIMKNAGYPPEAAVGFWERMAKKSGGKSPPEFLSTHPSDKTRINDIKVLISGGL